MKVINITVKFVMLSMLNAFVYLSGLSTASAQFNVQSAVNAAIANGGGTVNVPTGTYTFNGGLNFTNGKNVVLEGNGSTFVFKGTETTVGSGTNGVRISDCQNITLRNFKIDYNPLPFTQGTVVATGADYVDVQVDAGYRTDMAFFHATVNDLTLHFIDPATNKFARGIAAYFPGTSVSAASSGVLRFKGTPAPVNIIPGLRVFTAAYNNVAIDVYRSAVTKVDGVTILASGGAAHAEYGGDGGSDIRITVTPGPKPAGATQDRLTAATRDGIMSHDVKVGPNIHDTYMTRLGDDAINVNCQFFKVLNVSGNQITTQPLFGDNTASVNDTIKVFNPTTFKLKMTTTVTAFCGTNQEIWTLTSASGIAVNDLLYTNNRASANAKVINCKFEDIDGRGVLMRSNNAVIQNNILDGITCGGAVCISAQVGDYNEGPIPANITVTGNTITDCCFGGLALTSYWNQSGAITISFDIYDQSKLSSNREIKNITINNNTVDNCSVWGLLISNASGVNLTGNRFSRTNMTAPLGAGQQWKMTPNEAIFINASDNVSFVSGNVLSSIGPFGTNATRIEPNCTGINTTGLAVQGSALGFDGVGSGSDGIIAEFLCGFQSTASASKSLTKLRLNIASGTGKIKCAIYSNSANNTPGTRLASTPEYTNLPAGWNTLILTAPLAITAGTKYWLVTWTGSGSTYAIALDGTTGPVVYKEVPYGATWPGGGTGWATSNYTACIYAF